jgi:hypothetical protein
VAAVSPDRIGQEDTLGRPLFAPGGRGVIFYATELNAPRALGFAVSSGFDESFRLGKSSIYFAFYGEDRDQIRQAVELVNGRRVRLEERGILYASLRAGPAGKWTDDHLGTGPAPASGLVAYGPYVDLEPGQYHMSYRLKLANCGQSSPQLRIRLGVTANFGKMLAPTQLSVGVVDFSDDGCNARAGATFTVADSASGRAIEFPLWNEGPIAFLIEDIALVRVHEGMR